MCKLEKDLEDFSTNGVGGKKPVCKTCINAKERERYNRNKINNTMPFDWAYEN